MDRFTLNETALDKFLSKYFDGDTAVLDLDWDPTEVESASDIERLIRDVQEHSPILTGPANTEIVFVYDTDDDGGAYQWQVYLREPNLYLGSLWEEIRKVVTRDTYGIAAARELVTEATTRGTELLGKAAAWSQQVAD